MTAEDLQKLSDDQLQDVIAAAGKIIEARREEKRRKAIDEATARLAEVGLTFRDLAKLRTKPAKSDRAARAKLKPGDRYVNPADASQEWVVGRGRRPKWLNALEEKGAMPQPAPAETRQRKPA